MNDFDRTLELIHNAVKEEKIKKLVHLLSQFTTLERAHMHRELSSIELIEYSMAGLSEAMQIFYDLKDLDNEEIAPLKPTQFGSQIELLKNLPLLPASSLPTNNKPKPILSEVQSLDEDLDQLFKQITEYVNKLSEYNQELGENLIG
jgi:hypothetical protein